MTNLHLVRLRMDLPALMRFARDQGLLRDDDGHGYAMHAWLVAMFGALAPKPFRFIEERGELLGYMSSAAEALYEHAQSFASPQAWAALVPGSLACKPMPSIWNATRRLGVEVLACPVSRKDDLEKDVFLRAVDRLGDAVPPRAEVYCDWFRRQWGDAIQFEQLELAGFSRGRLLRRPRLDSATLVRKATSIERPRALFRAVVTVRDGGAFGDLVARGIGRHRAFGFGLVLVSPAP